MTERLRPENGGVPTDSVSSVHIDLVTSVPFYVVYARSIHTTFMPSLFRHSASMAMPVPSTMTCHSF